VAVCVQALHLQDNFRMRLLQAACLITLLDLVRNSPANTLFVLGLYSTGKEELALAVAEARQCQIFCTDEKRRQVEQHSALLGVCVTIVLHGNGRWIITLIHHPVAHVQTLQHLELTNAHRERFTEDQSNAGVVIAKAPHARDWGIDELNTMKHAAHCEHVSAIRPTGADPCYAAVGASCQKSRSNSCSCLEMTQCNDVQHIRFRRTWIH
jgi:hypothetical protein